MMKDVNSERAAARPYLILLAVTLACLIIVFLFPPIPQWQSYHEFADARAIWGIPNFWNVVSNGPYLLVGILGLLAMKRQWEAGHFVSGQEAAPFFMIFIGLILIAIGSSYYHLAPDNRRLVWDRIPMTLVFMSFVSMTLMERVHFKAGFWLLLPLIAVGIGSVWYWIWTESLGRGDLRPYAFIKFYPVALIFLILYLFPKPYPSTKSFLLLLLFFGMTTLFEMRDIQIYQMGGVISGHTLKHLFGAISAYWFVVMVDELEYRERLTGK